MTSISQKAMSRLLVFLLFFLPELVNAQETVASEEGSELKTLTILLIVFAFVVLFGLLFVIRAYRELKSQYGVITKQKNEIAEKNEELGFKNDALAAINAEKNTMLSVVAHDLKTPLGNIHGLVELISLEADKLTDQQKEYLDLIKKVVAESTSMVNNMLDVNKIESELHDMILVPQQVSKLTKKALKMNEALATAKGIVLEVRSNNEDVEVNTDQQYFSQILSNIVSNAVKYSPEGKTVSIIVTEKEHTVQVSIKDEGPGLSEDMQKRLFSGYSKASSDQKSGYGLVIVKRLVEKLSAKMRVESAEGAGTTFHLEFLK